MFSERVPAAWQLYWKKALAPVRPTAVILSADLHYLSLCGYCFRQGIRIPGDLSVICMESTEHLEWCEPVPTRMRFPVASAARYFKKWIRSGCKPLGMKFLPLDYVDAGSVVAIDRDGHKAVAARGLCQIHFLEADLVRHRGETQCHEGGETRDMHGLVWIRVLRRPGRDPVSTSKRNEAAHL